MTIEEYVDQEKSRLDRFQEHWNKNHRSIWVDKWDQSNWDYQWIGYQEMEKNSQAQTPVVSTSTI